MFTSKPPVVNSKLDEAIDDVLTQMTTISSDTDEYAAMVDQLSKLYSLKENEIPKRISPDTLATIAANLLGIIVIVGHERAHVLTSKAINFVMKLR